MLLIFSFFYVHIFFRYSLQVNHLVWPDPGKNSKDISSQSQGCAQWHLNCSFWSLPSTSCLFSLFAYSDIKDNGVPYLNEECNVLFVALSCWQTVSFLASYYTTILRKRRKVTKTKQNWKSVTRSRFLEAQSKNSLEWRLAFDTSSNKHYSRGPQSLGRFRTRPCKGADVRSSICASGGTPMHAWSSICVSSRHTSPHSHKWSFTRA